MAENPEAHRGEVTKQLPNPHTRIAASVLTEAHCFSPTAPNNAESRPVNSLAFVVNNLCQIRAALKKINHSGGNAIKEKFNPRYLLTKQSA